MRRRLRHPFPSPRALARGGEGLGVGPLGGEGFLKYLTRSTLLAETDVSTPQVNASRRGVVAQDPRFHWRLARDWQSPLGCAHASKIGALSFGRIFCPSVA